MIDKLLDEYKSACWLLVQLLAFLAGRSFHTKWHTAMAFVLVKDEPSMDHTFALTLAVGLSTNMLVPWATISVQVQSAYMNWPFQMWVARGKACCTHVLRVARKISTTLRGVYSASSVRLAFDLARAIAFSFHSECCGNWVHASDGFLSH